MEYESMVVRAGEVVIVSGPPGSGKSTIAGALAAEVDRGVHLESDRFYHWIRSGFVGPHLPEAHAQNTAVMDVATDAAAAYAEAGYAVVWDGIVGPWFLDRVLRRFASRQIAVRYLVLRPERSTALDRVRHRDNPSDTIGAESMFDQFADLGALESHVVDSDSPITAVLEAARATLTDDRLLIDSGVWVDDRWPVSVKGVVGWRDQVLVLKNRRNEWELPGGRLDATDSSPEVALGREFEEELGLSVDVLDLIDSWIYDVEGKRVLILTYACRATEPNELQHSDEHSDVALLPVERLEGAAIPAGYVASITRGRSHLR